MTVTDSEIMKRLRFQGLSEEDLGVFKSWKKACEGATDLLVDKFYDHIFGNQATSNIVNKHTTVEKQRPALTRYVLSLFAGRIDDAYVEYRRRVACGQEGTPGIGAFDAVGPQPLFLPGHVGRTMRRLHAGDDTQFGEARDIFRGSNLGMFDPQAGVSSPGNLLEGSISSWSVPSNMHRTRMGN